MGDLYSAASWQPDHQPSTLNHGLPPSSPLALALLVRRQRVVATNVAGWRCPLHRRVASPASRRICSAAPAPSRAAKLAIRAALGRLLALGLLPLLLLQGQATHRRGLKRTGPGRPWARQWRTRPGRPRVGWWRTGPGRPRTGQSRRAG